MDWSIEGGLLRTVTEEEHGCHGGLAARRWSENPLRAD